MSSETLTTLHRYVTARLAAFEGSTEPTKAHEDEAHEIIAMVLEAERQDALSRPVDETLLKASVAAAIGVPAISEVA